MFQGELLANMKLLEGKNSELKNFIQHLNGNCSVIQVKFVYKLLDNIVFFNTQ